MNLEGTFELIINEIIKKPQYELYLKLGESITFNYERIRQQ